MPLKVVCPSHHRPKQLDVLGAVLLDAIVVPESQRAAYEAAETGVEIVTHPDAIVGIGPKRQWILEKFGDVFMVDDDVTSFQRLYLPKFQARSRSTRMTPAEARALIESTYQLAGEFKCYLFGFAGGSDPRNYTGMKPFRLTGALNGAAFGFRRGHKLFFHPKIVAAHDIFVSGLNAFHHRYCLMDVRFGAAQRKTFGNPGGLAGIRTYESEVEDTEILKTQFGVAIKSRSGNRKRLGQVKSPGNRSLVVPY